MRFIDEQNQVVALFHLIDDAFDALFEHSPQPGPGHDPTHLQLHDVRVAQARWNFLRLEFDQTRQSFDHRGFADAWFADEHRRVRPLAMAKDFDDLLNLFFAADGGRNLVGAHQAIQREAKMFQVRRQLELLAILLLLFLALVYVCAHVFDDGFGLRAQIPQHLDKKTVVVRENVENVRGFDGLASARTSAFHRPLEKVSGIRSDAKAFADVLATAVQAIVDGPRHQVRIKSQTANGRIEKIRFFLSQRTDDVLDRDVVLIATL